MSDIVKALTLNIGELVTACIKTETRLKLLTITGSSAFFNPSLWIRLHLVGRYCLIYYFATTYTAVVGKLIICQCRTSVKNGDTSFRQLKENGRNKRQMREKIGLILHVPRNQIKSVQAQCVERCDIRAPIPVNV